MLSLDRCWDMRCLTCRESVVLKDLKDCSVYLLDYSGEVEVTNVQDSQIFIGKSITIRTLAGDAHLSMLSHECAVDLLYVKKFWSPHRNNFTSYMFRSLNPCRQQSLECKMPPLTSQTNALCPNNLQEDLCYDPSGWLSSIEGCGGPSLLTCIRTV